jgi:predicted kinase
MIPIRQGDPNKTLVIVRGCPGSGKSTLARLINNQLAKGSGVVLSTDDFYVNEEGKYVYDPTQLQVAHMWNIGRARQAMRSGKAHVIIDNVFSQAWEAKPYYELALLYNYTILVTWPSTPWRFNPTICAEKTTKGVARDAIFRVVNRWEKNFSFDHVMEQIAPENRRPGYVHPNAAKIKHSYEPTDLPKSSLPKLSEEDEYKKHRLKYGKAPEPKTPEEPK